MSWFTRLTKRSPAPAEGGGDVTGGSSEVAAPPPSGGPVPVPYPNTGDPVPAGSGPAGVDAIERRAGLDGIKGESTDGRYQALSAGGTTGDAASAEPYGAPIGRAGFDGVKGESTDKGHTSALSAAPATDGMEEEEVMARKAGESRQEYLRARTDGAPGGMQATDGGMEEEEVMARKAGGDQQEYLRARTDVAPSEMRATDGGMEEEELMARKAGESQQEYLRARTDGAPGGMQATDGGMEEEEVMARKAGESQQEYLTAPSKMPDPEEEPMVATRLGAAEPEEFPDTGAAGESGDAVASSIGINRLTLVTQMKSQGVKEEALFGASAGHDGEPPAPSTLVDLRPNDDLTDMLAGDPGIDGGVEDIDFDVDQDDIEL